MSSSQRIPVAAGLLEWARRTAGFDKTLAAKRLAVKEERLSAWESGELQPTINQLRNMAKLYKRPLAVLLLPAPPKEFDALRDFRRTGEPGDLSWSPALHAEYKRALSQREVLLELSELSPASVVSSNDMFRVNREINPEDAGTALRKFMGMDTWKSGTISNPRNALRAAVEAVESHGILVMQTRDVDISEMRGFSISAWPHPVIILNGSDWPRPKLFTLLHEMCHLALNAGGLCDLHESQAQRRSEDKVEHFCNRVAASALMPASRVMNDPVVRATTQWTLEGLLDASQRFGASSEAFLLRLVTLGLARWETYWRLKPQLDAHYARLRREEKEKQKSTPGGPPYFLIKARNLGRKYVESVLDAYHSRAISSYDVVDYLDIKYDQLTKLEEAVTR
ncbi:XRE family transcriptional regulator [Streptomyces dubilierae]|uniref:XRE family transcriptional regulator n=1 Tax=Streptomyces dubilierae TaxID=3075533 RepID=A0ABU2P8S3_9ACTN|nr:XRE family transcriptional regulator [Streptomyces sp. DSM 41921]MDT0388276.1 XRE family transcriptional regulator [Streptomyces sp. DSM 41921]